MIYQYDTRDLSGVYQIKNTVNNKIYVGSSKNLYNRFLEHRSLLRHNKHQNAHLQRAFNKYGENNFQFTILHLCENHPDILFDLEQWYVDVLHPEYNISVEVVNQPQKTEAIRIKQSETRKRLYKENKLNVFSKKIYLYYKDGSFVGEFESEMKAAQFINTTVDKISGVANGLWVQIKGYKAFFEKQDFVPPFQKPKFQPGKIYKHYDVIDDENNIIYSGSINDVAVFLQMSKDTIKHYINPKKPHKAKGEYVIRSHAAS